MSQVRGVAVSEMLIFEDIPIVTASRRMEKASEAPATVAVITAEEIERYGYRTLAEALQTLPGIYVNEDRNYTYIGVRGFAREGDYNSRIQMQLNGHPLADVNFDYVPAGEDLGIDMSTIDRIEIVYGPGSALYGSNALFATINIITREPKGYRSSEVDLEGGSFGRGKAALRMGGQVAGWNLGGGLSVLNVNGDDLFFPEFESMGLNGGVAENTDFENSYQVHARAERGPFSIQAYGVYRQKGIPTGAYDTVFNDDATRTTETHWFLDMKYTKNLSEKLDLTLRAAYDDLRYWGTYRYDDGFGGVVDNIDIARDRWIMQEAQLDYKISERNHLTFGQGFQRNLEVRQENFDEDPFFSYTDVDQTFNEYSAYAQHLYSPGSGWHLTTGLRYDDYSSFGSAVSPRFAVVYAPRESWSAKLMAGRAFRAPNSFELFYEDSFTQVAPLELDPEVMTSYELSIESLVVSRFKWRLALYRNRVSDLISLVEISPGWFQFTNLDKTSTHGGEVGVRARFMNGASGYLSYGYVRSEDSSNNELTNYSPHSAKAGISLPFRNQRWWVSANMQFYDDRLLLDGTRGPDVFLTNVTVLAPLFSKNARLSATIYNLFDRDYGWPAREEHAPLVLIPQDGRTFALRVQWDF
ncbi:MAG: TonB-dependent receptor [Acidobacteriota bacterium]